jgi:hypothetical protein
MWDSPFNQFFPVSVDALQPHIILLLSGDSLVQTTGILFIWGENYKKTANNLFLFVHKTCDSLIMHIVCVFIISLPSRILNISLLSKTM